MGFISQQNCQSLFGMKLFGVAVVEICSRMETRSCFHLYSEGSSSICRVCLYVASVPAALEDNQMQGITSGAEATAKVSTCVIWMDVSI